MRILVLIALLAWSCAAQSLNECRTVFVQPMPESLDQFLTAELSKWGVMKVVGTKEQADCVASFGQEASRDHSPLAPRIGWANNPRRQRAGDKWCTKRVRSCFVRFPDGYLVTTGGPKTLDRKLVRQLKRDYKTEK